MPIGPLKEIMKGSGVGDPEDDVQNYVFMGKPHNATISNPLTAGNNALLSNPYASAIDSHEFIRDNIPGGNPGTTASFNGTLYFWVHYTSNDTHVLADYEGGYAQYNLTGGVAAVTPPVTVDGFIISGRGNSPKAPERYIPVGQGFFVSAGDTGGGMIAFHNDQRVFQREYATPPSFNNGSVFLRSGNSNTIDPSSNDDEDLIKRIRLAFVTPEMATKRLLLGFVPEDKASDGFDYGYDAPSFNNDPSDMFWLIDGESYTIQGVGDFDKYKMHPIGLRIANSGMVEIELTGFENFETHKNVYVYDSMLGTYTKINKKSFKVELDVGEYLDRFYITFTKAQNEKLLDLEDNDIENTMVNYLASSKELYLRVPDGINVKQVQLLNLVGQLVSSWDNVNSFFVSGNEIKIPVRRLAEGTYIVNVETATGSFNKKIIINY
jgi:hypothetical protein